MKRITLLAMAVSFAGCHALAPYTATSADTWALDAAPDARSDAVLDGASPDINLNSDAGPLCPADRILCQGSCVPGTDCADCRTAKLLCAPSRRCVTGCGACRDVAGIRFPIECFACDADQNDPIGTCEPSDKSGFCLNSDYTTAHQGEAGEHCDCSNTEVSSCLGDHQVCKPAGSTDWCVTCGEAGLDTDGLPCKGGGTCDTTLSPPRCR